MLGTQNFLIKSVWTYSYKYNYKEFEREIKSLWTYSYKYNHNNSPASTCDCFFLLLFSCKCFLVCRARLNRDTTAGQLKEHSSYWPCLLDNRFRCSDSVFKGAGQGFMKFYYHWIYFSPMIVNISYISLDNLSCKVPYVCVQKKKGSLCFFIQHVFNLKPPCYRVDHQ